jgi:hypothetical protein
MPRRDKLNNPGQKLEGNQYKPFQIMKNSVLISYIQALI